MYNGTIHEAATRLNKIAYKLFKETAGLAIMIPEIVC